ncbi:hypothetical protein K1719_042950 [Acacia pycnantha]|nr:hypothetical protein K1719_042950 [Acacia pycnantha]
MVRQTEAGETTVIGILYKFGEPDDFLALLSTASEEHVKLLREAVDDDAEINARPLQPTNNRSVQLYEPTI